jgi:hypothetical protein
MGKPYFFSKVVDLPFAAAITATIDALGRHGFGVLTDIDVQKPGTPNKVTAELAGLARVHTPDALAALVVVMNDPAAPAAARVSAANALTSLVGNHAPVWPNLFRPLSV